MAEELRVGVVLTGGVSLCVWMGGVTNELNRFARRGGCYGDLLEALDYEPRIDVISGASAGGLNGAVLATALARDQDVEHLRSLWAQKGDLDLLLRSPADDGATSLLQGDAVFLEALREEFAALIHGDFDADPIPGSPDGLDPNLTLTVTTTLLDGQPEGFADDFGSLILEANHEGRLRFVRLRGDDPAAPIRDDFGGDGAADRLATAVRASASFPGAFEPVYIEVGEDRPFHGHANFSRSQYAVDGGVLVNKPMRIALDDIYAQPAVTPVRRVVAYVNPTPPRSAEREPAPSAKPPPPSVFEVIAGSVIGVRGVESLAEDLAELRDHNRHVRNRRESLDAFASSMPDPSTGLRSLATSVYETYRVTRRDGAVTHLVEVVLESATGERSTTYDVRVLHARLGACAQELGASGELPWLPPAGFSGGHLPGTAKSPWKWGIWAAEGAVTTALGFLDRVQRLAADLGADEHAARLIDDRRLVSRALQGTISARHAEVRFWKERVPDALRHLEQLMTGDDSEAGDTAATKPTSGDVDAAEPVGDPADRPSEGLGAWLQAAAHEWSREHTLTGVGAHAHAAAEALCAVRLHASAVVARGKEIATSSVEAQRVEAMLEMLVPGDDPTDCLDQLLFLEIVQGFIRTPQRLLDQRVEMILVSTDAQNSLVSTPPHAKVTGTQLNRFGAFYKRSWRYNDWMWGRMDGAERIVRLILDPARLKAYLLAQERKRVSAVDAIMAIAVADEPDIARRSLLASSFEADRPELTIELRRLLTADLLPSALPITAGVLARRPQLEIACVEVPLLRAAIALDEQDRDQRTRKELVSAHPAAPAEAVELLRGLSVGTERITAELSSNRAIVLSSKAAAVASSMIANTGVSLGRVGSPLRIVRGLGRSVWTLTTALVQGSRAVISLILLASAIAGVWLATAITVGDLAAVPTIVVLFGAALLLVGIVRVARLVGWQVPFLALTVIAVLVTVMLLLPTVAPDDTSGGVQRLMTYRILIITVALVLFLFFLGGVGASQRRTAGRWPLVASWAFVVVVVVGLTLIAWVLAEGIARHRDRVDARGDAIVLAEQDPPAVDDPLVATPMRLRPPDPDAHHAVATVDLGVRVAEDPQSSLVAIVFEQSTDARRYIERELGILELGGGPCTDVEETSDCVLLDGRTVVVASAEAITERQQLAVLGRSLLR